MFYYLCNETIYTKSTMKRLFLIVFFICICQHHAKAFDILSACGGRTNSLANCSVALNDFWSCHNNPAGFASSNEIGFGISYQNKFMLKELGYKNAGFLYPLNVGVLAVSFSQFGYDLYNENNLGIGLARNFGPNLRIGLKFDYLLFKYSGEYRNKHAPTFELGMQYQINESLCLGAYIFNPINVRIKSLVKEKTPIIMRLGFSYLISKDFMLTSEIEENHEYNFSYRFGLEYEIYKDIFIRSGFQLSPELFTLGIGYNYDWCIVDICAQMNQTLGASLNCSFVFKINEKE